MAPSLDSRQEGGKGPSSHRRLTFSTQNSSPFCCERPKGHPRGLGALPEIHIVANHSSNELLSDMRLDGCLTALSQKLFCIFLCLHCSTTCGLELSNCSQTRTEMTCSNSTVCSRAHCGSPYRQQANATAWPAVRWIRHTCVSAWSMRMKSLEEQPAGNLPSACAAGLRSTSGILVQW